jgi:cAMP-dependent protein kinase regulator
LAKEEPKYIKTYMPGESFGEVNLLYEGPRNASVRAKTDCVLWVIDRDVFTYLSREAAMRKREKYENFLSKIEIL